jgi:hypothetical protein
VSFHSSNTKHRSVTVTSSEDKAQAETQTDLELIERVADEYKERLIALQESGSLEIHPPHAIAAWAHNVYHYVFNPMLQEAMTSYHQDMQARGEDLESFDGSDILENCVRLVATNAFVLGFECRDKGHSFHPCKCGELNDEKIKELFGDSNC